MRINIKVMIVVVKIKDFGHIPVIFIRFNPDKYFIGDTKIESCWTINKNGISSIKNNCIKQWNERLNILKQQIEYWTDPINKTNETLEIIQLFFDK
jgi:penicillin-binding protein-related factor A (putative recombinase)